MSGVGFLLLLLSSVVNTVIIAVFVRRLLGVPVGWPRTFALSLVVNLGTSPLLTWALTRVGVHEAPQSAGTEMAVALLVIVLIVAWVLAAEVGLLAIGEALVPTGSVPGPVELLRSLPGRWRRTRRYSAIVRTAGRHGLASFLTARRGPRHDRSTPAALRAALSDGGVTFIKLGQMLATRPDVLPPAYVEELERLHSSVPPQDWARTEATLVEELGPLTDHFSDLDREPLAAASVGQVHRAVLTTGERVVVKVQRADARAQVTADLDIVMRLAGFLQRNAPWARQIGVLRLARGFAESLEDELDYRVERRNLEALTRTTEGVRIPAAWPALSTARVLTMEEAAGTPLSSSAERIAALTPEQRSASAGLLLDVVLGQVMNGGVFHADLHGGNVLIDADGSLTLLDFGSVGRLDRGARQALGLLLIAVERQDGVAATDALLDLLDPPADVDLRQLSREVGDLVMRFATGEGAEAMFGAVFALVMRHGIGVPAGVAAAFRSLGALEGTLQLLDPDIDLVSAARARARAHVVRPATVRELVEGQLMSLVPAIQRLPRQLTSLVGQLEAGTFAVTVRSLAERQERSFLSGLVQQVVTTVLAATTAVCGIVLALSGHGPMMTADLRLTTYLGLVLLLFAFVLGCRVVVLVFRGSFEDRRAP